MTALRHMIRDAIVTRAIHIAAEQHIDLPAAIQRASDERFAQLCARLDANARHREQRLAPSVLQDEIQASAHYRRWNAPWMARD
jgi:hypothetical protein